MKIKCLCVGKVKEKYFKEALKEYEKRLQAYCKLEIIECPEQRAPEGLSDLEKKQILDKEGRGILSHIKDRDEVVILAVEGEEIDSPALARKLEKWEMQGRDLVFVIGGSFGLSKEVEERARWAWSFSPLTFPHQLMRVLLLEQVYRGFRIKSGHPYHK